MTTRSELLYGVLFLLVAFIARSVSLSMSVSLLRDAVSMLSVVMLTGGVIVIVVGLWHAARRDETPAPTPTSSIAGWFPDRHDAFLLRYWDGHAWTGETALRGTTQVTS